MGVGQGVHACKVRHINDDSDVVMRVKQWLTLNRFSSQFHVGILACL
jgi:hypothetical protein